VINAVFPRDSCWDETHCRGGVHSRPDERSLDDRRLDVVRRGEEKRSQAARLDRHAFPGVASAGRRVGQHSAGRVRISEHLGAVRMKIVSHYRRTAGWVYDQCRF
jgi:hypothetical protein